MEKAVLASPALSHYMWEHCHHHSSSLLYMAWSSSRWFFKLNWPVLICQIPNFFHSIQGVNLGQGTILLEFKFPCSIRAHSLKARCRRLIFSVYIAAAEVFCNRSLLSRLDKFSKRRLVQPNSFKSKLLVMTGSAFPIEGHKGMWSGVGLERDDMSQVGTGPPTQKRQEPDQVSRR